MIKPKLLWTPETSRAFEECKNSVAFAILMNFISISAQLILKTNASNLAIRAALKQLKDNKWKPIAFFSRRLNKTEKNYDRELLAIFAAIKDALSRIYAIQIPTILSSIKRRRRISSTISK